MDKEAIQAAMSKRTVCLPDGTLVPAIGQGTWNMGENPAEKKAEIAALRLGVDLGMSLIDTAEMYGEGKSEQVVGEAIKGIRDDVFLVSKVYPHNAGKDRLFSSCEQSLKRLGTDHLDLYLLHWRGRVPLAETIEGMEQLKKEGKIARWGVSNFDTDDMKELLNTPGGGNCATNQVLYHLGSRGIEYDLLPWHQENNLPIMAYSPLAQGGSLRKELLHDPVVRKISDAHQAEPLQVALAWSIRSNHVIAIPKAGKEKHVTANAQASALLLNTDELNQLDTVFSPPARKMPLDII